MLKANNDTASGSGPVDIFGEYLYYYGKQDDPLVPVYKSGNIGGQDIYTSPSMTHYRYAYDDLDRLTSAYWDHDGEMEESEQFWYDLNGNRTDYTHKMLFIFDTDSTHYTYATGTNKLQTLAGAVNSTFSFDPNGNMGYYQSKKATFGYDPLNRLKTATIDNTLYPDNFLNFVYTPSGERVYKRYQYYWRELCNPDPPPPEELLMQGQSGDCGIVWKDSGQDSAYLMLLESEEAAKRLQIRSFRLLCVTTPRNRPKSMLGDIKNLILPESGQILPRNFGCPAPYSLQAAERLL